MATINLLDYDLAVCTFNLIPGTRATSVNGGNRVNVTDQYDTLWEVQVETRPLERLNRQRWRAWRGRLRGGLNRFRMYDIGQNKPYDHRDKDTFTDVDAGWDGNATITSISGGELQLSALPANYRLRAGDYIGLLESNKYDLHTVDTTVTANGSGVVTVDVSPYIKDSLFTTSATAVIWQPQCEFLLDEGSWREANDARVGPSPISFRGVQVIYK